MRNSFILLVSLAAALVPIAVAAGAPTQAACTPGMSTVGGHPARTFCGPATATVKLGGKTYTFTDGQCSKTGDYFALNIGTVELGAKTKTKPYFGLFVGRAPGSSNPRAGGDGVYKFHPTIAFNFPGSEAAVKGVVTLSNKRSKGSFVGKVILVNTPASGSFSC